MLTDPLAWWREAIGEVAPVGHALRSHFHSNWTRLHSLPESKRYAETEAEYNEVIRRHTEIANILFATGEPIFIYRSRLQESTLIGNEKHEVAGIQLSDLAMKLRVNPATVAPEDDDHYFVRGLISAWKPTFFEEIVRHVADEVESSISFVAPRTKNMYCPYDGGMDTFAFSIPPKILSTRFSHWLSSRADYL